MGFENVCFYHGSHQPYTVVWGSTATPNMIDSGRAVENEKTNKQGKCCERAEIKGLEDSGHSVSLYFSRWKNNMSHQHKQTDEINVYYSQPKIAY